MQVFWLLKRRADISRHAGPFPTSSSGWCKTHSLFFPNPQPFGSFSFHPEPGFWDQHGQGVQVSINLPAAENALVDIELTPAERC